MSSHTTDAFPPNLDLDPGDERDAVFRTQPLPARTLRVDARALGTSDKALKS